MVCFIYAIVLVLCVFSFWSDAKVYMYRFLYDLLNE